MGKDFLGADQPKGPEKEEEKEMEALGPGSRQAESKI